ncbi:SUMF1/EgtB/PvdO family nonheme iron enzyme [Azospirillum sp. TSO22-1]|uniref:SUMF1/EgtB/PvdO family nonheme iron enzyme n=1 Tax=Azospirillum sp. TSO22-1 TaxID=716789 RepID=UPI000D640F05|nr:SUMF1/EgtB/PvdO family nonheme iron enzyme [Azospirillum sp. TSO22-1]
MRTAVILTAIDVETEHVLKHLGETSREIRQGQVFRVGQFHGATGPWRVAVAQERGNDMAALNATMAIMHYKPDVALLVGVAGGVKDAGIGDVVVSTKIYGYESGKVTPDGFHARPDPYRPDQALLALARDLARANEWKGRRLYRKPHDNRTAYLGPIASGEKVVADRHSDLVAFLRSHFNDALAVETEGHGFATAAHALRSAQWLVFRGVSDLLSGKSETDAAHGQEYAIDSAAALAFQLLSELPVEGMPDGRRADPAGEVAHEPAVSKASSVHASSNDPEPADPEGRQRRWAQRFGLPARFPLDIPALGVSIAMALIPPGDFTMGSRDRTEEFPPQALAIRHPYAISCTAVPAWLFARWRPDVSFAHADMPAVNVDWQTAVDFTAWLSQTTGSRIRLPSEAEWEYAARAGTDTDFWCGGQVLGDFNVGSGDASDAARGRVRTVDSCTPNPWGLYHMHGNVWEWVADGWRRGLSGQPGSGAAWTGDPTDRVIKGGSCRDPAGMARSASRRQRDPSRPSDIIGFRIVMDLHHKGHL